jgi:hypothetical protein
MGKTRYLGGFTGTGRHRRTAKHDGTWKHMRTLFMRHADSTTTATIESLFTSDQYDHTFRAVPAGETIDSL